MRATIPPGPDRPMSDHDAAEALQSMLDSSVLSVEDWEVLPPSVRQELVCSRTTAALFARLQEEGLLTPYQVERLRAGKTAGLVLGNYRLLSRLGAGSMGVVYKAEHLTLRRPAALKVVAAPREQSPRL